MLRIALPIAILLVSLTGFAQTDSISQKNDSINAAVLEAYNQRIAQIETQRINDSLKKAALEIQLKSLKLPTT